MNKIIDGLNINYICEGEGDLVLLLHGWGSNITLFQNTVNLLSQNTLLGHSFGGRVIIKLCSRQLPFEIEKVILVDSAGVKPEKTTAQKIKQSTYKMTKKISATLWVQKCSRTRLKIFAAKTVLPITMRLRR